MTKNGSRSNKSYSQRKRDRMDYRSVYFAHNPGLFGCIWTCAYCHRPLVGRHNVEVDHIVPLNNPFGRNARYNLVAACPACNGKKSDTVDGRIVKGYVSKVFEIAIFSIQKLFLICFIGLWTLLSLIICWIKEILALPFRNSSFKVKIIAFITYVIIAVIIYRYFRY